MLSAVARWAQVSTNEDNDSRITDLLCVFAGSIGAGKPSSSADYDVVVRAGGTIELSAVVSHDPAGKNIESNSWFVWFDDQSKSSSKWDIKGLTTAMSRYNILQKFDLGPGLHTLHVGVRERFTRMQSLKIEAGRAAFLCTRAGSNSVSMCILLSVV